MLLLLVYVRYEDGVFKFRVTVSSNIKTHPKVGHFLIKRPSKHLLKTPWQPSAALALIKGSVQNSLPRKDTHSVSIGILLG